MPDLSFKIEGAEVAKFSATPLIAFKLRVSNAESSRDHTLGCAAQPDSD